MVCLLWWLGGVRRSARSAVGRRRPTLSCLAVAVLSPCCVSLCVCRVGLAASGVVRGGAVAGGGSPGVACVSLWFAGLSLLLRRSRVCGGTSAWGALSSIFVSGCLGVISSLAPVVCFFLLRPWASYIFGSACVGRVPFPGPLRLVGRGCPRPSPPVAGWLLGPGSLGVSCLPRSLGSLRCICSAAALLIGFTGLVLSSLRDLLAVRHFFVSLCPVMHCALHVGSVLPLPAHGLLLCCARHLQRWRICALCSCHDWLRMLGVSLFPLYAALLAAPFFRFVCLQCFLAFFPSCRAFFCPHSCRMRLFSLFSESFALLHFASTSALCELLVFLASVLGFAAFGVFPISSFFCAPLSIGVSAFPFQTPVSYVWGASPHRSAFFLLEASSFSFFYFLFTALLSALHSVCAASFPGL